MFTGLLAPHCMLQGSAGLGNPCLQPHKQNKDPQTISLSIYE